MKRHIPTFESFVNESLKGYEVNDLYVVTADITCYEFAGKTESPNPNIKRGNWIDGSTLYKDTRVSIEKVERDGIYVKDSSARDKAWYQYFIEEPELKKLKKV